MYNKKRGVGHIEMILAFILFIGFIIFSFFFLSPFESQKTLRSSLDYAFIEILGNSQSDLEIYTIIIHSTHSDIIGVEIDRTIRDVNLYVRRNRETLNSELNGNKAFFRHSGTKEIVEVMFSDAFPKLRGGTSEEILIYGQDYEISSSEKKKIISEKKIIDIKNNYNTNYFTLKQRFNLSNRIDFGFELAFDNGDKITALREIPKNLEVLSVVDRVEVVRSLNGEIEYAELTIKVW